MEVGVLITIGGVLFLGCFRGRMREYACVYTHTLTLFSIYIYFYRLASIDRA